MTKTIAVLGATGDLGGRIVGELVQRGALVRAFVRPGTSGEKLTKLQRPTIEIVEVDYKDNAKLVKALTGVACVVSALQGLRDVIVDAQSTILDAAVAAGVARFIPSDYSIDFTKLSPGGNRNLDLRREFHARLDKAKIAATSVLNGAFAELLTSRMPLLDFEAKKVSFWGDADQKMDFTTMGDTAAVTAAAALDPNAPRFVRVAGDQISARELASLASDVCKTKFELVQAGPVEALAGFIQKTRAADPASEKQLFPRWQGMQYMHDMFSGRAKLAPLDNGRYPDVKWTTARDLIVAHWTKLGRN